jgi:hypothetical protein
MLKFITIIKKLEIGSPYINRKHQQSRKCTNIKTHSRKEIVCNHTYTLTNSCNVKRKKLVLPNNLNHSYYKVQENVNINCSVHYINIVLPEINVNKVYDIYQMYHRYVKQQMMQFASTMISTIFKH